jgi:Rrf2 family cysteine metabolism transcriptional repressor
MIRFSTRGEYGIRMMMVLARHHGEGPLSLPQIARHEALPATYLEQLVGGLRKAGLITSSHGAHGGYQLARPPAQVSVGEVMRVLEGPISPMICATEGETEMLCERQVFCSANIVWERVREGIATALDSLTLADLIPPKSPISLEEEHTIRLTPVGENATASPAAGYQPFAIGYQSRERRRKSATSVGRSATS